MYLVSSKLHGTISANTTYISMFDARKAGEWKAELKDITEMKNSSCAEIYKTVKLWVCIWHEGLKKYTYKILFGNTRKMKEYWSLKYTN